MMPKFKKISILFSYILLLLTIVLVPVINTHNLLNYDESILTKVNPNPGTKIIKFIEIPVKNYKVKIDNLFILKYYFIYRECIIRLCWMIRIIYTVFYFFTFHTFYIIISFLVINGQTGSEEFGNLIPFEHFAPEFIFKDKVIDIGSV